MTTQQGKFLLFAGENYYPNGGYKDFKGIFSSIDAAKKEGERLINQYHLNSFDWYHIVSLTTFTTVYDNSEVSK